MINAGYPITFYEIPEQMLLNHWWY